MRRETFLGSFILFLCLGCMLLCSACGKPAESNSPETTAAVPAEDAAVPTPSPEPRTARQVIEDLAVYYGRYGEGARAQVRSCLQELRDLDPDAADRWELIMALWQSVNHDLKVHYDVLPDGLPDTDELCMVVLGFQLNEDGTMKDELKDRLEVVLASAEKYPRALIVCTGGGTAAEDETATEAGKMAEWLVENGIDKSRVIVEDKSVTTAQNAMFTYDILTKEYPQVSQLAVISSDYHIATGTLLFSAESTLRAESISRKKLAVVTNAACREETGVLSPMFQAGALIELAGDTETAFEIYYDTYDIHDLPKVTE